MTTEQLEAYALHFRIEEISQSLRDDNWDRTNPRARSTSPPPEYDASGRRTNTRERRYRQRLEEERQRLVDAALQTFDGYKVPPGFSHRRNGLIRDKVFIPVRDFPSLKFIGQILGTKDPSRRAAAVFPNGPALLTMQEPLHCLIAADSQQKVDRAKGLINGVIESVICMPEDQNERKRHQLRRLAQMNGTFRDDEHQVCQNCGQHGHRQYACLEAKRVAANVICHVCRNAGHLARDCPDRKGTGSSVPPWRRDMAPRLTSGVTEGDRDFEQFMLELGN
ncbi:hypothetical protein VSDG_09971 [Cytospora chrysosperma]|uniref:Branchpoint-bridging protein n=1 Tax=Cytospora chrysosperma TaxID=252740 RepID=A0A423V8K3_CYTCH|nr:hypothetical protein VSDG_09971 [Valsa sordida]